MPQPPAVQKPMITPPGRPGGLQRRPVLSLPEPPGVCIHPVGRPGATCGAARVKNSHYCKQHQYLEELPPEARVPVSRGGWKMPQKTLEADRTFHMEVTLRVPASYGEDRVIDLKMVTPHVDELDSPNRLAGRMYLDLEKALVTLFTEARNGGKKEG
jgi:hypothetical protein